MRDAGTHQAYGIMLTRAFQLGRLIGSVHTGGSLPPPRRAKPILATLNLTENCQSRCLMCDYWRRHSPEEIGTDRAERLLKELWELGVSSLRFLGGEPLLRRDLFSVLDRTRDFSFKRITLATNGLLVGRYSPQINQSRITNITVSLDGYGDDHDRVRGVPGGFRKIVSGLGKVADKRIKICALVTRHLVDGIDDLLALCAKHDWAFDVVLPSFDLPFARNAESVSNLHDLWPTSAQSAEILEKVVEAGHIPPVIAEAAHRYLVDRVYPQSTCLMGHLHVQVRANGDLLSGCYELAPLGNILTQSVDEIISSPAYAQRLKAMFRMDCPGCVCGWQLSYAAQRPVAMLSYMRKRTITGSRT